MILHLVVLLFGSVWLSVMSENIAGFRTFSLPFLNILLVMLVGATLSIWSGWTETLSTITVYGAYCVIGGLIDRLS